MTNKVYTPPPSLLDFFQSDKFINLVMGPVGSTKTTAGILKIVHEAKRIAACPDGIRRSRAIWIRQSREQLRDTSIPDFLSWLPDGLAGTFHKTEYKFLLEFDDVSCEVLFRGLDDAGDVRRLLSLQATFAIADEFRELNPAVFDALTGRLGRYPSKALNGVGCKDDYGNQIDKMWGMSNPPDTDTFWEQYLQNPPDNAAVFFQPSGLSQEADWLQYLKDDYYPNLCEGKSDAWIQVFVHGKFGASLSGKPVWPAFEKGMHVAKTALSPIRMSTHPILIGVDFGLQPAAAIGQVDPSGRLLVFNDLVSEGMGILRFTREKLKPLLANKFAGMNILIIGDPAGTQRGQTDEKSCFDILKAEGFRVIPAKTNSILPRVNAVDALLTRTVDGKSGIILDPTGTPNLQAALRGGYRYKIKTNGEMDDSPEKNRHSHIADAMQYLALHADGNATGGARRTQAVHVEKTRFLYS
jgi:hypothetical protein